MRVVWTISGIVHEIYEAVDDGNSVLIAVVGHAGVRR
jgi:hypothetical protein